MLKLTASDGTEFKTFKELDLSLYFLASHTYLPGIGRYPKILDSYIIFLFYFSLFGKTEDDDPSVASIESYVIYDNKSESKFAIKSWLLGSDDIKRIIDALKAGKSVDIICKSYDWKNDLRTDEDVLFEEAYIESYYTEIIRKIKYCSNLNLVSDLKRCISCLFGIDSSDVIVYKLVEEVGEGGEESDEGAEGKEGEEGEDGKEGQYTILNDNDEICSCIIGFSEKYKCVEYVIKFFRDSKKFGKKKLRSDIDQSFGRNKITFNYCDVSDEESFKNALKKEFAFLENVDFKLEFINGDLNPIDFDRDKVCTVNIIITSPNDICVNNTETKTITIKLIGGHFWEGNADGFEIDIPVSTMSYSDIIAGLKKTMDLKFGKGAGEKFRYKLFIDGKPVEFLSAARVIDNASGKSFLVYIEDDDFTNKLKAGGVVVSGKAGKGVDSVQKGCCKCQSCRKNRVK